MPHSSNIEQELSPLPQLLYESVHEAVGLDSLDVSHSLFLSLSLRLGTIINAAGWNSSPFPTTHADIYLYKMDQNGLPQPKGPNNYIDPNNSE